MSKDLHILRVLSYSLIAVISLAVASSAQDSTKYVTISEILERPDLYDSLEVCAEGMITGLHAKNEMGELVDPPYLNLKGFYKKRLNLNFGALSDQETVEERSLKLKFDDVKQLLGHEVYVCGIFKKNDRSIIVFHASKISDSILY